MCIKVFSKTKTQKHIPDRSNFALAFRFKNYIIILNKSQGSNIRKQALSYKSTFAKV